jgi:hypothetical protein
MTRPFLCIADDGAAYFVKGADAGWGSLVSEWVAGSLGRLLELPIPEFRLVEVDDELLRYSTFEEKDRLGVGVWFGSRCVPATEELTWQQLRLVPLPLQAEILLFDWWVANGDRTLTQLGGNPNLLWAPVGQRLHLIDHNLAFDSHGLDEHTALHAFRPAGRVWDEAFRKEQIGRLQVAAEQLERIWAEMPPEWTNRDCDVTFDVVRSLIWRFQADPDKFWALP